MLPLGELDDASQAGTTALRDGMKDAFATNKRDLDDGVEGVRSTLGGLCVHSRRADTAHATADENKGITGFLEVIESGFSKNLAEISANCRVCRCDQGDCK